MTPDANIPFFSIITSVYNGKDEIEQTILSISRQSFRDFEFIVVDGGSKDGTQEILKKHNDIITKWISEPDSGIYNAWNKGVRLAKGKWIAFVGAGDRLLPDALARYADYIRANDGLDYVSSRVQLEDAGKISRVIGESWQWPKFQRYMCVGHVGSMHNASLYKRLGMYDETYRITGDYEFLLRAGDKLRTGFIDSPTAVMKVGGVSNSNARVFKEAMRAKIETGKRSYAMALADNWYARAKFMIRRALNK